MSIHHADAEHGRKHAHDALVDRCLGNVFSKPCSDCVWTHVLLPRHLLVEPLHDGRAVTCAPVLHADSQLQAPLEQYA